jgi:hypothetical protein
LSAGSARRRRPCLTSLASARAIVCSTWPLGWAGRRWRAARRVGPRGSVLATDIAPQILQYAELEARRAGVANVTTRVLDVKSAVSGRAEALTLASTVPSAVRDLLGELGTSRELLRAGDACG